MKEETPDASYRRELGMVSNPMCPDYHAHYENAGERVVGAGWFKRVLTFDEQGNIDAETDAEYLACEGH